MSKPTLAARLENLLFGHRLLVIGLFVLATTGFVLVGVGPAHRRRLRQAAAAQAPVHGDLPQAPAGVRRRQPACWSRWWPATATCSRPEFFDALKGATDEVFFLPGVDRGRVQSLFTPNVRYTEVVEDGIAAGNVIPDDFTTTPEGLEAVRRNILKAGIVGRLVANDFSRRDHQRRAAGVRPDDRASASTSSRWRSDIETRVRREVRRGRSCPARPVDRAHHRVRQGDGRHRRRRPAGRCSSSSAASS